MILEHFALLAQIQGLDKQIGLHLKTISAQEERILLLQKQRESRKKQLEEAESDLRKVKTEYSQKEKELLEIENLISRSLDRQKSATTEAQCRAIESELNKALPLKESLEEQNYQLMEKIEGIQTLIKEHQTFLEGSEKTLFDITKEVSAKTQQEKDQVKKLEERIQIDLATLPPSSQKVWEELNKKFRFNSPLSFVENGLCLECRYTIGRNLENQIEKGGILEFCPNCKRLLTPRKRV